MIEKNKIIINLFIGLLISLFAGLIIYFIYNLIVFRITNINPVKILPDSTDTIIISYNKKLGEKSKQPKTLLSISPTKYLSYRIDNNKIFITLPEPYKNGEKVTLKIKNIVSVSGSVINESTINYDVKYVKFNSLNKEQQKIQIEQSVITESSNPFLAKLPYGSTDDINNKPYFLIGYKAKGDVGNDTNWKTKKNNYCVVINTNAQNFYEEGTENFIGLTKLWRNNALEWIKSQGVIPGQDINYTFEPASNSPGLAYDPPDSCK
jgi:hypothetical protein